MKPESLNDLATNSSSLPRIRQAAIRDLVRENSKQDFETLRNIVWAYCLDKGITLDAVGFDQDGKYECVTVQYNGTVYYFKKN